MHIHYTIQMLDWATSCISERGSIEHVWSQHFIQTVYTWGLSSPREEMGRLGKKKEKREWGNVGKVKETQAIVDEPVWQWDKTCLAM